MTNQAPRWGEMDYHGKIITLAGEVKAERHRQIEKWGEQHHEFRREHTQVAYLPWEAHFKRLFEEQGDSPTWDVILLEEVYEALAEDDNTKRVEELIQVAAVALAIIEDLKNEGA